MAMRTDVCRDQDKNKMLSSCSSKVKHGSAGFSLQGQFRVSCPRTLRHADRRRRRSMVSAGPSTSWATAACISKQHVYNVREVIGFLTVSLFFFPVSNTLWEQSWWSKVEWMSHTPNRAAIMHCCSNSLPRDRS